jgi:hypothetical protein
MLANADPEPSSWEIESARALVQEVIMLSPGISYKETVWGQDDLIRDLARELRTIPQTNDAKAKARMKLARFAVANDYIQKMQANPRWPNSVKSSFAGLSRVCRLWSSLGGALVKAVVLPAAATLGLADVAAVTLSEKKNRMQQEAALEFLKEHQLLSENDRLTSLSASKIQKFPQKISLGSTHLLSKIDSGKDALNVFYSLTKQSAQKQTLQTIKISKKTFTTQNIKGESLQARYLQIIDNDQTANFFLLDDGSLVRVPSEALKLHLKALGSLKN